MTNAGMMMRRIDNVGQHAGWFIALGALYIVGGVVALAAPFWAGVGVSAIVGWVLVFVGVGTLFQAWQTSTWGGVIWQIVIGLIILIGGLGAIIDPIGAAIGLTLLIGIMFLAKGVAQIVMAFNMRPLRVWSWMLSAGILAAIIGVIIIWQWPFSGTWVIGTLAGVSLIMSGFSYIMMAIGARRIAHA